MLFPFGLGHILSWSIKSQFLIFIIMIVLLGVALIRLNWRKRAQVNQIAAHLNRKYPELEESSELFLQPGKCTLLQRMQLSRIEPVLTKIKIQSVLPNNLLVSGFKWLFVLGLITAILAIWAPQISSKKEFSFKPMRQQGKEVVAKNSDPPPNVESIRIEISPPAYTRKPKKTSKNPNLSVAEGSEIKWRIKLDKSVESAKLVLNNVDTLVFMENPNRTYTLGYNATESGFYYLELNSGQGIFTVSDFYQLEVIKDKPASVFVVHPDQRTEIKFDELANVNLVVEVKDDYGFDKAKIFATVTRGGDPGFMSMKAMPGLAGARDKKSKQLVCDRLLIQE